MGRRSGSSWPVPLILRALERGSVLGVDQLDSESAPAALSSWFDSSWIRRATRGMRSWCSTPTIRLCSEIFSESRACIATRSGSSRKDQEGASRLYPLTDFKPRKFENLERGYLQGRYGAIPFIVSQLVTRDA